MQFFPNFMQKNENVTQLYIEVLICGADASISDPGHGKTVTFERNFRESLNFTNMHVKRRECIFV